MNGDGLEQADSLLTSFMICATVTPTTYDASMSITFVLIRIIKHLRKEFLKWTFLSPYLLLHTLPQTMDKLLKPVMKEIQTFLIRS
jgi:hypothetical protein